MTADPTSTDPQARWHGTPGGYTNHSCRCQACTTAHTAYRRPNKSKAELESLREQLREAVLDAENLGRKLGEAEARERRTRDELVAMDRAYRNAREEVKRWKELAAALDGLMAHYKLGTTNTRKAVRAVDRVRDARAALQPTPRAAGSPQADTEAREP